MELISTAYTLQTQALLCLKTVELDSSPNTDNSGRESAWEFISDVTQKTNNIYSYIINIRTEEQSKQKQNQTVQKKQETKETDLKRDKGSTWT